ncbi:hypothetical protein BLD48_12235 [Exiguobacterium sp. KRL4]|uniref:hypothetical protein n=1 Tax=Exiguobacterium sp. KRL4 TaxID=1914536 RepID=UPI0008F95774|nr:hypothetical protein [Exiguobacterium sp. KRL4]OIN66111.1 hypothetical protein BLD48_12235 [Exiguobacterium sp. KRL4]
MQRVDSSGNGAAYVSEWLSAQGISFEQILLSEAIPTNLSVLHSDPTKIVGVHQAFLQDVSLPSLQLQPDMSVQQFTDVMSTYAIHLNPAE